MGFLQIRLVALLLVLFLTLERVAPALAQDTQPPVSRTVIPAGTRFSVTLKQKLESGKGKAGDAVSFSVTNDVLSPDGKTVWIPRGTAAAGTLQLSDGPKNHGRPGKLAFSCDAVKQGEFGQIPVRLISPASRKGADLRPLLTLIVLPFYLCGAFAIYDDATTTYAWVDGLGFLLGVVVISFGALVQTLLGAFIKGKRVRVAEGSTFEVEVLPYGNQ